MGDLLIRRRELVLASAPTPSEWDYEWYYTDGLPGSDWTKNGADTPSLISTGLQVNRTYYTKEVEITNGVIEGKFSIPSYRTNMNTYRAILRIGNSTNSVYVVFVRYNSNDIRLRDSSSWNNGTLIGANGWVFGGEYVVRITINGAVGAVEVNGVTLTDSVDTTTMYLPGALMFGCNEQYGRSVWQYVKYKSLD